MGVERGVRQDGGGIRLALLGPMRLSHDGGDIALPASKKTRALLAYLAAADRPVRRERLCNLLWDVPDDPRGALRWSLSRLRGLIDTPGQDWLVADRDSVSLVPGSIDVDWRRLRSLAQGRVAEATTPELEQAAALGGEFIEGLELSRCEEFAAWSVAQREDVRRWRVAILAELLVRDIDPVSALGHAREWVRLDPFEGKARVALVTALERAGRRAEIGPQRDLGLRKLKEGDAVVPAALRATKVKPAAEPAQAALPVQHVRFCTASDGAGLAWSAVGDGPPLVKTANWLNHLEYDWASPVWRHWLSALTHQHRLVRYDERGTGLSDWNVADISFDAFVDDLASVVDAAGLERFDLLGVSQGCAIAVAYAARHPHRVRRLVLYGGYLAGWRVRATPGEVALRAAMTTLIHEGWGQNNPAFRQMFSTLFFPDATPMEMDWFNELQRMTASPENAGRLQKAFGDIDVRALAGRIATPTLVLHARNDAVVPFDAGRAMAAAIPDARFIALEGRNHLLRESEPAWARFIASLRDFLTD